MLSIPSTIGSGQQMSALNKSRNSAWLIVGTVYGWNDRKRAAGEGLGGGAPLEDVVPQGLVLLPQRPRVERLPLVPQRRVQQPLRVCVWVLTPVSAVC